MRKMVITGLSFLLIIKFALAEGPIQPFQVYGYRVPYLKSGEYFLSFACHKQVIEQSLSYQHSTLPAINSSRQEELAIGVQGVLALTGYMFLKLNLDYYPQQSNHKSPVPPNEIVNKPHTAFNFELAVHPRQNIEIFGTYLTDTREMVYDYDRNTPSDPIVSKVLISRLSNQYFSIGVNLFGHLWR